MFHKKAQFIPFSDIRPLNNVRMPFYVDQKLSVDDNILKDTVQAIYRYASTVEARTEKDGNDTVFDLEAEIKEHPDSLFVKCFAIKADEPNDNGDYFSRDELRKSYQTFVGCNVFTNHQNTDIEQSRGKIVHSWWDDDRNGIMIIARVDASAYPQLARGIKEEYIVGTSMGCQVQYSLCSICHNRAETPDQYCGHIRERKTRKISAREECRFHKNGKEENCPICGCKKGEKKALVSKDSAVFEYNYGIKFIENSFVVNPACHECGVTEVIDPAAFMSKVAELGNKFPKLGVKFIKEAFGFNHNAKSYSIEDIIDPNVFITTVINLRDYLPGMLKAAANTPVMCTDQKCVKLAGQKELGMLQSALDLTVQVSQSMLQQKDQIDLEFLTDLVNVVADLQAVYDELNQQGYGRLPSPGEAAPGQSAPANPAVPGQSQPSLSPLNPTPGGGSNIQSGSAGEVGTVTTPAFSKRLVLDKFATPLIPPRKKNITAQKDEIIIRTASRSRKLEFKFKFGN